MTRMTGLAAATLVVVLSLALPVSAAARAVPSVPAPDGSSHLVRDGGGQGGGQGDSGGGDNGNNNGNNGHGDGNQNNDNQNGGANRNNDGNGGSNNQNSGDGHGDSNARVVVEFVSATNTTVTWRLRPTAGGSLAVWDGTAESCQAQGGASCGALTSDGAATFSASGGTKQALIVTQSFSTRDQSCKVVHQAQFAANDQATDRTTASGVYRCSGASALGWPLLAVLFAAGVAGAWWVHRKAARWARR